MGLILKSTYLDNNVCESAVDAVSVHKVESMEQEQYNNFRQCV